MELRPVIYNPPRENIRVKRLCDAPFFTELLDFYLENEATIPWTNSFPTLQSAVQTRAPNSDDVFSGCGAGALIPGQELDYQFLALRYQDTVLQKVLNALPVEMRRLRWMRLMGKSCYSIHRDPTPRIHIPLITYPEACFMFPQDGAVHLETGGVYWVDTVEYHTFMNGNEQPRVHLVGAVEP